MIGKVVEVAIKTTFGNHIYLFHNKLFKQLKGGPIGLRLTGVVARIVMDQWARRFREVLENNQVTVHLFRKYVDDVNLAISRIATGMKWDSKPG